MAVRNRTDRGGLPRTCGGPAGSSATRPLHVRMPLPVRALVGVRTLLRVRMPPAPTVAPPPRVALLLSVGGCLALLGLFVPGQGLGRPSDSEVETLVLTLRTGSEGESNRAVERLRYLQSPAASRRLRHMLADPEDRARTRAAWALGILRDREAAPALEQLLGDPVPDVRIAAAQALGEIGARQAVAALVRALGDPNRHVRVAAVRALGKLGDARSIRALLKALTSDDVQVRLLAASGLLAANDPKVAARLRERLAEEPSSGVRLVIARGLARRSDKTAVRYLVRALLTDADRTVRREAASALGLVKGEESRRALELALMDEDEDVRALAKASLKNRGEWKGGDQGGAARREKGD